MILAIRAFRATIFAFNASICVAIVWFEAAPEPAIAADVPDLLPTIAVTVAVDDVELGMKVAAVANFPLTVDFVAGATTAPFDATSDTEVPSATG